MQCPAALDKQSFTIKRVYSPALELNVRLAGHSLIVNHHSSTIPVNHTKLSYSGTRGAMTSSSNQVGYGMKIWAEGTGDTGADPEIE
jgi:hypothetical protein